MNQQIQKDYYSIIGEIWKVFRKHIDTVASIQSATDEKWREICNDFTRIESAAPPHLKKYAGDMVALHVWELERRWRK